MNILTSQPDIFTPWFDLSDHLQLICCSKPLYSAFASNLKRRIELDDVQLFGQLCQNGFYHLAFNTTKITATSYISHLQYHVQKWLLECKRIPKTKDDIDKWFRLFDLCGKPSFFYAFVYKNCSFELFQRLYKAIPPKTLDFTSYFDNYDTDTQLLNITMADMDYYYSLSYTSSQYHFEPSFFEPHFYRILAIAKARNVVKFARLTDEVPSFAKCIRHFIKTRDLNDKDEFETLTWMLQYCICIGECFNQIPPKSKVQEWVFDNIDMELQLGHISLSWAEQLFAIDSQFVIDKLLPRFSNREKFTCFLECEPSEFTKKYLYIPVESIYNAHSLRSKINPLALKYYSNSLSNNEKLRKQFGSFLDSQPLSFIKQFQSLYNENWHGNYWLCNHILSKPFNPFNFDYETSINQLKEIEIYKGKKWERSDFKMHTILNLVVQKIFDNIVNKLFTIKRKSC